MEISMGKDKALKKKKHTKKNNLHNRKRESSQNTSS
jgi:hypothetical protein